MVKEKLKMHDQNDILLLLLFNLSNEGRKRKCSYHIVQEVWKERLNSDGHKFQKNQQSEQSPFTFHLCSLNTKKTTKIQVLA